LLRLWKIRPGGHSYYLEVADGTGTGVEPAGVWLGKAVPDLGLSGHVEEDTLGSVLRGEHPLTAKALSNHQNRVVVAGYDLTFCAPKSVSLLHALGDPEVSGEVAEGQRCAVESSVRYLEDHALAVRRPVGDHRIPTPVRGMTAAAFLHRTSRALDPHLHTHVVVANLGQGEEGRWSALDGRGLYAHRAAADAFYHSQLRHELTSRLGVDWIEGRGGRADLVGISEEARFAFSRRSIAIAKELESHGLAGTRATELAATRTRDPKDIALSPLDLKPSWRARASEVGLSPRQLDRILDRTPRIEAASGSFRREAAEVSVGVLKTLGEISPTATRRQVMRTFCLALPKGAPRNEIEGAVDRIVGNLDAVRGPLGERSGPGVAERQYQVTKHLGFELEEAKADQRELKSARDTKELDRLLAARGMGRAPDRTRGSELDLGVGLG